MEKPTHPFYAAFGHNLKYIADIDDESCELVCKTCSKHFISTSNGGLVEINLPLEIPSYANYFNRKKNQKTFNLRLKI